MLDLRIYRMCFTVCVFHFTPDSHTLGELQKKGPEPRNGQSPVVQNLLQRVWLMVDKGGSSEYFGWKAHQRGMMWNVI